VALRRAVAVTAVGDDDQAIYQWRGGDVSLFVRFPQRFTGAERLCLDENHRSRAAISARAADVTSGRSAAMRRVRSDGQGRRSVIRSGARGAFCARPDRRAPTQFLRSLADALALVTTASVKDLLVAAALAGKGCGARRAD
jgi:hypothetical protein